MRSRRLLAGSAALLVLAVIAGLVVRSHLPPPNPSLTYLDAHGMTAFLLHAKEPITLAEAEQVMRGSRGTFSPAVQTAPMSVELLRLRARHGAPAHLEPVWLKPWTGTWTSEASTVVPCSASGCGNQSMAADPHMNAVVSALTGQLLFSFASP